MVVRLAAYFGGWPEHIWAWPLHYYRAILREYLKIISPTKADDGSVIRRTVGPVTVEEFKRE